MHVTKRNYAVRIAYVAQISVADVSQGRLASSIETLVCATLTLHELESEENWRTSYIGYRQLFTQHQLDRHTYQNIDCANLLIMIALWAIEHEVFSSIGFLFKNKESNLKNRFLLTL